MVIASVFTKMNVHGIVYVDRSSIILCMHVLLSSNISYTSAKHNGFLYMCMVALGSYRVCIPA